MPGRSTLATWWRSGLPSTSDGLLRQRRGGCTIQTLGSQYRRGRLAVDLHRRQALGEHVLAGRREGQARSMTPLRDGAGDPHRARHRRATRAPSRSWTRIHGSRAPRPHGARSTYARSASAGSGPSTTGDGRHQVGEPRAPGDRRMAPRISAASPAAGRAWCLGGQRAERVRGQSAARVEDLLYHASNALGQRLVLAVPPKAAGVALRDHLVGLVVEQEPGGRPAPRRGIPTTGSPHRRGGCTPATPR